MIISTNQNNKRRFGLQGLFAGLVCLCLLLGPAVPAAAAEEPAAAEELPAAQHPAAQQPAAQQPADDWSKPVNISNSGSTSLPELVVDKNGTSYVIWLDQFAGYRFAQSTPEGEWSEPAGGRFPFGEFAPRLAASDENGISAFWRDEDRNLFASRVQSRDFGNTWSWSTNRVLGQEVAAYDVAVDSSGIIHVVYLNLEDTERSPSGIYYRRSFPGGNAWSDASLIYSSLYLRGLAEEEINLSISAGEWDGKKVVYVGWDENLLSKVYYSRTLDDGKTWGEPVVVDELSAGSDNPPPFGVDVAVWGDQVLFSWKRGTPDSNCTVVYQASTDRGESFVSQGPMAAGLNGCAEDSHFYLNNPNMLVWQTTVNNQVYLSAWDGSQWSEPQIQPGLLGTEDPVSNRPISLGCWKTFYSPETNSLMAAGCDLNGNQDVWFATKVLEDPRSWFPEETVWKKPAVIFEVQSEVSSLHVLADSSGGLHSLWTQPLQITSGSNLETSPTIHDAIYYSNFDGTAWSQPVAIMQTPRGKISHFSAAITPEGILHISWQGSQTGEMYFSWANAARAFIPAEWAEPVILPVPEAIAGSPDIAVWQGQIYVLYAVPINETRGVYLTRSTDGGSSFSQPVQVFDGLAAGWEVVGHPSLTITYDGQLHAMWVRETLPGTRGTLGLYYARSADQGQSWSEAQVVTEGSVLWGETAASPDGSLYQIWQESDGTQIFRARVSTDFGATWKKLDALANDGTPSGSADVFFDPTGKLYMLQFVKDKTANLAIQDWETQGGSWTFNKHPHPGLADTRISSMAGVVSQAGLFGIVYVTTSGSEIGGEGSPAVKNSFYFTSRSVELPEVNLPTAQPPSAQVETAASPTSAVATVEPTATLAPTLPIEEIQDGPAPAESNWTGLIISIGLSGLIVVIGFVVLLSRSRVH